MDDWQKLLSELAKKMTPPLAYAVIVIIVLGLLGERIPAQYVTLVYLLSLGVAVLWALIEIALLIRKGRLETPAEKPTDSQFTQPQEPSKAPKEDPRTAYLQVIIEKCRSLRLVGIDPQAADPLRGGLTLESVYTQLDTTTLVELGEEKAVIEKQERIPDWLFYLEKRRHPLGALEALSGADSRRMVLLGQPGTGKSTFVRYLALRMAQAEMDRSRSVQDLLPGWQGGAVLPVLISLGWLAETIPADCKQGRARLIEAYLIESLQMDERTAPFAGCILDELKRSGGLVLFDGLDEVADLKLRPIVVQAIEDFVQSYGKHPASRFLVTCRTYSYTHDPKWQLTGWETHELALLDDKKIRFFINAWHDAHIGIDKGREQDYERKRKSMLAALQPNDRRRLDEIAPFPILLTMMAMVHTHYGELPDTRAEVYERCVDLLLVRWELERPIVGQPNQTRKRTIIDELGIPRVVLDRALWEVAYKAHQGRPAEDEGERRAALVTEDLLCGVLQAHFQDLDKVKIFLEYCQSSNGLLMLQGSVMPPDAPPGAPPRRIYAFPHPTFEEYLAARYLIRPNFGKTVRDMARSSDRWREVILLLGETLCFFQKDQERMESLLDKLAPQDAPSTSHDPDWRPIWYAGDLLTLYRRAFPGEPASSDERIRRLLYELVVRVALSPRERASAADALDELGYLPEDLYDFIAIPSDEAPAFFIAKYPVTNLQYERFLKSGRFAERQWWVNFPMFDEKSRRMRGKSWGSQGWEWLQTALKDEDNPVRDGVLYPRDWDDPRFGIARKTAPVVGITWYEANAYCRWLAQERGLPEWGSLGRLNRGGGTLEIRLPAEAEWAEAAGGEANDRFAWGVLKDPKEEIVRYANTAESGLVRTTPVWMYPQGASPRRVMDLSGNVWEWQANFYDKDHDMLSLRGGSWSGNWSSARVANRDFNPPSSYWLIGGFRPVARPV